VTVDSADSAGTERRRRDARARVRVPVLAAALFATYLFASFVLSGGTDIRQFSSGIFDMDVARVVSDLATPAPALRESVHPLQKVLVAPLGGALNTLFFAGGNPLGAARVLIALCMTLQTFGCAWLAWQLTRRSRSAAAAAGVVCAFSFSTWLAASIPESAAVASVATLLPLVFLNVRWKLPFSAWEAVAWAAIATLAVGLTLTQVIHCAIAFGVRATLGRPAPVADGGPVSPAPWRQLALSVVLFAVLFAGGLGLQKTFYPSERSDEHENPLAVELHFTRLESLRAEPVAHLGRLLGHFVVFDFVAPYPGYSDFLIRDYDLRWWSLSIEEAGPEQWKPPQVALAALTLLCVLLAATGFRRADAKYVAPALCVGSQFALHIFYGREYVLYSPHWHGVWVALLVAAAWQAFPKRRRPMLAFAAVLATAFLVNDLAVLRQTYREVDSGLHTQVRNLDGTPIVR